MSPEDINSARLEALLKKYNTENVVGMLDSQQLCMKEHQQRVAQMASTVALAMGLSESEEEAIFIAASLHDIGFVDTSFNIDVGKVNFKCIYEKLKEHSEIGANILKNLKLPTQIGNIVLQHHEKPDGSGFPYGIKDVMIEAQIIAVADTIDGVLSIHSKDEDQAIKHAIDMIDGMRNELINHEIIDVAIDQLNRRNMTF
jgi:putative nucleotidyltransferase with HDIG domain